MNSINIEVTINYENVFEKNAKTKHLQSIASLPVDVLETISELGSDKGIKMLREHKELLKSFI